MSTSTVPGPISIANALPLNPQIQGSSLNQLGKTLIGTVETLQNLILKIQSVVQMVFAELMGRLASIMTCFQSFSVCMEKFEEAFCPKPVVPDLGTSIKEILASLNGIVTPASPNAASVV